jgi:carbon storage regulator
MLVLSRKEGERIVIGGNIVVTIVASRGERVRIGIEAPPEVPIHRQEILHRIQSERHLPRVATAPHEPIFHPEFA